MNIAAELEKHAGDELQHAIIIAKQIDYLGGDPAVEQMPVHQATDAQEMLRLDLDNETRTIGHYRQRVRQCEALGEFAVAEHIRKILVDEQDHQIALATALGIEVPEVSNEPEQVTGDWHTAKPTVS
jgi:bacterioferritin